MDEARFRHALQVGHGRAVLYARSHDVSKFRDVILDACLHFRGVDAQVEGTRAGFMMDVLSTLPGRDFYCEAVLRALPGDLENWDAVQRFYFACFLAEKGNEQAKQAMYEAYRPGPRFGENIGTLFLDLDGVKGLLFVADKIGTLLLERPDEVDSGWLISRAIRELGEQVTRDALREASAGNPQIEAYRAAAEARENRNTDGREERDAFRHLPYEDLRTQITNEKWWLDLDSWGDKASALDLEKAAHGLLAATDPEEQRVHLNLFHGRAFPLNPALLFPFAEGTKRRVAFAALKALSILTHPVVRELAFRLIDSHSAYRQEAIKLLACNFHDGDHAIALSWFSAEQEPDSLHWLAHGLRDLWEAHPDEAFEVPMLLACYERGPCSFCRELVVRRLIELNALPGHLREECAWDANDDVRDLVAPSAQTDARPEE